MDEQIFLTWLHDTKHLEFRSARDVISRLRRAFNILDTQEVSSESLTELEKSDEFKGLSITVRSQLRRAINLYNEFLMSYAAY